MKQRCRKKGPRNYVVLPMEVASKTIRLLRRAARKKSNAPRLERQMEDAAASLERHVAKSSDGRVRVPEKQFLDVLRTLGYVFVVFRKEIASLIDALMDN